MTLLGKVFRLHKCKPGWPCRTDKTCIKIKVLWKYLYRAVYTSGYTIDILQTARRHSAAALRFFRKISLHGEPEVVTFDKVAPMPWH
ncbi:TPA: IS6 family transposase [Escherichia coli]|nr:IS6 family transposase [Escherichia coli]HAW7808492.1 IS6 family transposase [Escherichia coli]